MARIVVIGAGMAGHAAALGLKHRLGADHEVIVISPAKNWINPDTLAHVAANLRDAQRDSVSLGPLYRRKGIIFHQGAARVLYPRGFKDDPRPQVEMTFSGSYMSGEQARVPYDYLIIATGHDVDRVAGIPADATTIPTCVIDRVDSAVAGAKELRRIVSELLDSPLNITPKCIAVGRSYQGMGGYYGAVEYVLAVDHLLRSEGARKRVELHFFDAARQWMPTFGSNADSEIERQVRDEVENLLTRRSIKLHRGMRLSSINGQYLRYVPVSGSDTAADPGIPGEIPCDLVVTEAARVLTPLKVRDRDGEDIAGVLYDGWGRLRVDASQIEDTATGKITEIWPRTFRNPSFRNVYGIGSAISLDCYEPQPGANIPHSPIQTRDMAHLMSRQVSEQIYTEVSGQPVRTVPEKLEEMESVMSLAWDYSLFSRQGFYAEFQSVSSSLREVVSRGGVSTSMPYDAASRRMKKPPALKTEISKESFVSSADRHLKIYRGLRAYWTVLLERFIEKYRANGRALWWLLPS